MHLPPLLFCESALLSPCRLLGLCSLVLGSRGAPLSRSVRPPPWTRASLAEVFFISLSKVFFLSLIAIVRDHTMIDESLSHVNEGVLDIVVLDT